MKTLSVAVIAFALTGSLLASSALAQDSKKDPSHTLEYTKWSGEVNVPDPISITMDDQGRAYVTQTQRRKSQDLDIRNNRDWIADDVGLDSVEAKRAFFRRKLSIENSEVNKERVQDYNKDGVHDYRDLMVLSENIHLIEDTDGDGTADSIKLFADDFKTEVTGIAAGVLWHEGEVYSTIAPDVWKLKDTDGDGVADEREVMATGFGLHIAYGGHDMHGLIVGPDGKIYWSIGDKAINIVSKEGKHFYYPNQGGVMRCNPDGSDLEVFAHGLRNVQEFAFDEYGNWFGVDNDSDQKGEMERFVYIVEGMDAGWRNNYQYRGGDYNPWMAEGLSIPHFEGQAAYIVPAIRNYVDGPAGFVYNPGTALNPQYKGYFFLNSTLRGAQYAFRVEQNGASFAMKDDHQIGAGKPLIGLTLGPDGALYTVDWGGGYPLNQKGAVWKIDDATGADRTARKEVATLISEGMGERSLSALKKLLGHVDQRIRLRAQFELVKRGETRTLVSESKKGEQLKRIHAIWGLGQLARNDDATAIKTVVELLGDVDPEIQVQASKVLADLDPGAFEGTVLIPLLASESPRVRFQAGIAVGNHRVAGAYDAVVKLIVENDGKDLYLRHAGVMALAGIGGAERLSDHPSEEARLCAVVALRKKYDPAVERFLNDVSPNVVREAARAIHDDLSIPEAMPALAAMIDGLDRADEALAYRVINANLRLGGADQARQVARYASNSSVAMAYRLEALSALSDWIRPPLLDRVDGRRRDHERRSTAPIAEAVGAVLGDLLGSQDGALVEKVVAAAERLGVELDNGALQQLLTNEQASAELRVLALESLNSDASISYALQSNVMELRSKAAVLLAKRDPARAVQAFSDSLQKSDSLVEKQAALVSLSTIDRQDAKAIIGTWAKRLESGEVPAALQLDVVEAASKLGFKDAVAAYEAGRDASDPLAAYLECLEGGDAKRGETIVNTHLGSQCVRCHRTSSSSGSNIGPNLKSIGSDKDRAYLLRSLVDPGADIAPGFGVVSVTLKDGNTVSGQLGKETKDSLEILSLDGSSKKIKKSEVASRTAAISSMPPMGFVLSKRELRDVVEYLSSLKDGN